MKYSIEQMKKNALLIREKLGYTIVDVHRKLGLNYRTIKNMEDPNNDQLPDLKSVIAICNLYQCSIDTLFGIDSDSCGAINAAYESGYTAAYAEHKKMISEINKVIGNG